ncbi:Uncharacterised protein [Vibrio cholerae]|nr:Uncharacterised protein [Vibrio cholerae]
MITLTLNWVSISSALKITTSSLSTAAPFELGLAYSLAEISR